MGNRSMSLTFEKQYLHRVSSKAIKADCNSLNIYSDLTCTTVAGTLPLDGICYPVSNSTMGGGPLDFAFSASKSSLFSSRSAMEWIN